MKLQLVSVFGLLTLSEASAIFRRACGNNCGNAINRAANGAADCAMYWPNTVQAGIFTEVVYATMTETATQTATETETVTDTSTDLSTETSTSTDLFTSTHTQTSTLTVYDTVTFTSDSTVVATTVQVTSPTTIGLITGEVPQKRAEPTSTLITEGGSTGLAPPYASPCINWARYSEACSCLTARGVPQSTTTQTFTSTVTSTSGYTIPATTTSISTSLVTVTVSITTTITGTISATETVSLVLDTATSLFINASTTTYTPATTVTETNIATQTWVAIQIVGRETDANKAGQYLDLSYEVANFAGVFNLAWKTTTADAKFYWNQNTRQIKVVKDDVVRFICPQQPAANSIVSVYVMEEALCTTFYAPKLRLYLNSANGYMTLDNARYTKLAYRANSNYLVMAEPSVDLAAYYSTEVFIKAINGLEEPAT
ncbi:hypothetical protein TWF718_003748 [Orbilia javanica]|uniref:Uncharacterized protein n=1 Tax=Orbilia javanica TaxID=47235 RepID=A0AAN8RKG8_9PEZI